MPPLNTRIKFAVGVGGSMRPLLKDGDVLFFEPVSPANVNTGDVVFYDAGGNMCCHRVWWKKDNLVCLAGDSGTAKAIFKDITCVKAKLVDSRPWSKGITGLIYGLTCAALFNLLRLIKRFMMTILCAGGRGSDRKNMAAVLLF